MHLKVGATVPCIKRCRLVAPLALAVSAKEYGRDHVWIATEHAPHDNELLWLRRRTAEAVGTGFRSVFQAGVDLSREFD